MTTSESTSASAGGPAAGGPPPRRRPTPEAVADVVVTALLLGLFGWAFLETAQWSPRAALFPRMVTATAVVLTALHLVQAVLRLRRPSPPLDEASPDDVEYVFRTAGTRRWASALAWVAAFFVLLYLTGLYVTAPVFSLLYLRVAAKRTLIFSAIYAIVMGVLLYVAFELALGVPTPPGLLVD